jgi:hypothetical protein
MKTCRKTMALLLSLAIIFVALITPVSAASKVDPSEGPMQKVEAVFYQFVDKLIYAFGQAINTFMPGIDLGKLEDYQIPDTFYSGEESFDTQVTTESVWSAGYAYGSLLEGLNILGGKYLMAGALQTFKGQTPTEILDDQGVNVYAISDGVSGTVVQAVIDGYGIARGDVLAIRERLASFAKENNIISINISVLHQHSLIDTLGMGAPIVPAIILNPGINAFGIDESNLIGGKNSEFMENLYDVVTDTVIRAVKDMEEGTLYYGSTDVSDLMYDKRKPVSFDGEIHRLRFDPINEASDEIWICEAGIHCTGFSGSDTAISSDFPYYFKEYVKETTGADVVYIQGAEAAITTERDGIKYENIAKNSKVKAYGIELAKRAMAIIDETALDPVLNIKLREVVITADNQIHILAVRQGLVDSVATKDGSDFVIITELGYMELGNKIGIAMVPGEFAPEILWGGGTTKEESWTKESWDYDTWESISKADKLLCFGLCNDQIGYILPDNDIRAMLTENEEINVSSTVSASTLTDSFISIISESK